MSADAPDSTPDSPAGKPPVRRRALPLVMIAIASVLAFLSVFALWANRQLLNTDNWTSTSSELLENDAIRQQLSVFLVDELYAYVDVQARIAEALPPRLAPLAGPAAGGLRNLAVDGTDQLLGRPLPQELWEKANRRAHTLFMQVVDGGGDVISTQGGDVTLDLKTLLGETADRVGVGGRVEGRLPEDSAEVTILQSDNLELAQDAVRVLRGAAVVLVALSLALYAVAIWVAAGWRREALRATGWGLILAGAAALVARTLAGDEIVGALATTESVEPAAEAAWSISTSLLVEAASAGIAYGVVIVFAAWLAGSTAWATGARGALAPYLREPAIAYGALAALVLLLLAWGPTPATRRVIPVLVLVGLIALGVELLRRQTAREFPDASREESLRRVRARVSSTGQWLRGGRAPASATGDGSSARLEDLERLGRLRDTGVVDSSEFETEKARLLATPPVAPPRPG